MILCIDCTMYHTEDVCMHIHTYIIGCIRTYNNKGCKYMPAGLMGPGAPCMGTLLWVEHIY